MRLPPRNRAQIRCIPTPTLMHQAGAFAFEDVLLPREMQAYEACRKPPHLDLSGVRRSTADSGIFGDAGFCETRSDHYGQAGVGRSLTLLATCLSSGALLHCMMMI